jgi:hypothetical protein
MSHPVCPSFIRAASALAIAAAVLAVACACGAEVPRTIAYQGVLTNEAGSAVSDGDYSMTFSLHDVESGGAALWRETHPAVPVNKGIFNVVLGSLTPMLPPFDVPYWLGIRVADGTELSPRMRLASAAYSIRAENANRVNDIPASATATANALFPLGLDAKFPASVLPAGLPPGAHASTHNDGGSDEINVTSALIQNGTIIAEDLANGSVTSPKLAPPIALEATSSMPVFAGSNYGSGHGTYFQAGSGSGVVGVSTNGIGIYGSSQNNYGISGYTNAGTVGVMGQSLNAGYGLFGFGYDAGAYCISDVSGGNGIVGVCYPGPYSYGVWGMSDAGYGVVGGGSTGVFGESSADGGQAVYGHGSGSNTEGVLGVSEMNIGVYGISNGSSGNNFGVWGQNNVGTGVVGSSTSGTAVLAFGTFVATGTKSAEVKLDDGTPIRLFSEEATEVFFSDYGSAALSGGYARVELDPAFLQTVTIDEKHPMKVFVQLEGDCRGVFVANKSATGFDVVELQGGASSAPFSYRVVCKRKHYEDERLATAEQEAVYNKRMMETVWPEVLTQQQAKRDDLEAMKKQTEQHRLKRERLQAVKVDRPQVPQRAAAPAGER